MSEWLTTGQLIEKLNIGEEAVCQEFRSWLIKNTEEEGILWEDGSKFYISNEIIRTAKWRILPKYVKFEEAMKALKDGKYVQFHDSDNSRLSAHMNGHLCWYNKFTWKQLFEGKWQIIE